MERSSRRSRTPSILSDSVRQRLHVYALAASAAGAGMLACPRPSEAKIVCTPVHHVIGKNSYFAIDLNHDGIQDFAVSNSARHIGKALINSINVWANHGESAGVEVSGVRPPDTFLASALKGGAVISNTLNFASRGQMVAQCAHGTQESGPPCSSHPYNTFGNWINIKHRYLGLLFTVHGKTHYGWARLNVKVSKTQHTVSATITGCAYETIANKPIIAGRTKGPDEIGMGEPDATLHIPTREPASLGLLAMGTPGLSIWRREEVAAARP